MNCECPNCNKSFPVDPNKVPPDGVFARCSNCQEVFFVQVPGEGEDGAAPAAVAESTTEGEAPVAVEEPSGPPQEKEAVEPEPVPEEVEVDTEEVEAAPVGEEAGQEPDEESSTEPEPQFGRRAPEEKAQRLARVLVSDIILYNPDRHEQALAAGQIKEEFEDEIQKSWNEYVDQVGEEVANSTNFFNEALNEILCKGEQLF
jgi:predicted Zn finger-like uncharacterized protein